MGRLLAPVSQSSTSRATARSAGAPHRQGRWTGEFTTLLHMAGIPNNLIMRAHSVLGGRDVVDNVSRSVNEVTLDHKLPMKRWNEVTSKQQPTIKT